MSAIAPQTAVSDWHLLKWMLHFLKPVKGLAIMACLYLAVGTGAEILTVRQTAQAINRVKLTPVGSHVGEQGFWAWLAGHSPDADGLRQAVLLLAGFSLVMGVLAYLREVANMKLSMNKVFFIREAVYDKLQRVGLRFHDRISTGELINRSLNDLQNVRSFVNTAVLSTLEIGLVVGGYVILLLTLTPWAALLALLPLPFWVWRTLVFSRQMRPAQEAVMKSGDDNVSLITENIAGVHVVKAFATEEHEIAKFNRNCDEFCDRVLGRIRLFANYIPVIRSISMVSHLALFMLAGFLIIRGVLHAGDILVLGGAMGAILNRLQQVAAINEQYQNAVVSGRRLYEVLAADQTVPALADARPLPPGSGAVRFDHVTFGYDPGKPVVHDVSFEVAGGQVIALVGPTGSGKSTLVQLLARFYDPQCGRILVDGADIRHVTLDSLRAEIAFVFQETYLFSDSVAANIAYGRPQVRGDEVEDVARLAQAHEFVASLPSGYQTVLGERGTTLSGGQRQRLAIARAVFARPRVLILDDATASVDPETEELIHGAVRSTLRGCSVFVIAHRLNTVKRADVVIVLENGRVTQVGTHDELMRTDGHYRDIAAVQLYSDDEWAAGPEPAEEPAGLHGPQRVASESLPSSDSGPEAAP